MTIKQPSMQKNNFGFFHIRPDLQKEGKLLKGDNCAFKEEELKKLYFPHENI